MVTDITLLALLGGALFAVISILASVRGEVGQMRADMDRNRAELSGRVDAQTSRIDALMDRFGRRDGER